MPVQLAEPPTAYDAFCETLRSRGPTLNLLFEQARISHAREGDTLVRDAFAGAVIWVLNGMLREYWSSLRGTKPEWRCTGPLFAGCSIGQILTAAQDNTRHFEEWDAEKTATLLQRRNVRVLSAVLGITLKKNSKHPPFRGNVSWAVLEALCLSDGYRALESLVREFALGLQNAHAV